MHLTSPAAPAGERATMTTFDPKAHWERVYAERAPSEVSWYQRAPALSLALVERSGVAKDDPIIDVGGGASTLVDHLLAAGYQRAAVLDISARALDHARARLGAAAERVEWYEADVTDFTPPHRFALWHDRAVFHFLTEETQRQAYLRSLNEALLPDGQVIIAAFGQGGPTKCSGLDVVRYNPVSLGAVLGDGFRLVEAVSETHLTPAGKTQRFEYHHFARRRG
jgi:SAM-dependent methyltransferase